MNHADFVELYRQGHIKVNINRSAAMHVCDRDRRIGGPRRGAHSLWKNVGCLLPVAGIISLFWLPWFYCVGGVLLGFIVLPAVQHSAAGFVLETALEDPLFYEDMVATGVLKVDHTRG